MLNRIIFFSLVSLYSFTALQAQDKVYKNKFQSDFIFQHLKEDDGLSYNIINNFLKDSRGILWICTYNGFNRFDGSNFFRYKIRKGGNSLTNEAIHGLCEDWNGDIWGCTSNGVFCYKIKEDRFVNYTFDHLKSPRWFFNILCTKDSMLVTTYSDHLFVYNLQKDVFEVAARLNQGMDSIKDMYATKNGMILDKSGKYLLISTNYGIVGYDLKTKTVLNAASNPNEALFRQRNVSPIAYSNSDNFWIFDGMANQLELISPHNFKIVRKISLNSLDNFGHLNSIFEDRNNRLWISSWNYNVCVVDLESEIFTPLKHDPQDIRSINANLFWGAYQDDDNTVWLGTVNGIALCNPESRIYKEYRLAHTIPELKNKNIYRLSEDPTDHTFWMVTNNDVMIHYDPIKNTHEVFDLNKSKPNKQGNMPNFVNQINFYQDWVIVSAYHGSWQLKKGDHRFVPYNILPKDYKDFQCTEMFIKDDSIYFSNGREILFWEVNKNQTQLYSFEPDSTLPMQGKIISNIMMDNQNTVWMISPTKHLAYLNEVNKLSRINMYQEGMQGDGSILSLGVDSKNKLWYVFNNIGLFNYDPKTNKIKVWNETDGLPGNRLQQMKIDSYDRIWSMMYNKISVYIPESDAFYNFKIPYSEHDYNYVNNMVRRTNGNIIGSISNEIVEFLPHRLFAQQVINKPKISQVIASGREIPVFNKNSIRLPLNENTVRILFGSYTHNEIIPYELEYRLSGAEESWTVVGKSSEAVYNNLSPGTYTFEIKSKSKNNQWISEIEKLEIVILEPFYRTWWFIILVMTVLSIVVFYIIRSKEEGKRNITLLKSKTQALEKEKAIVMYENLKQHLNPHFLFNSLTSLSSLIRIDPKQAGDFLDKMSKVYRYILRNKDNETVSLMDELSFVDIYVQLQKTRFEEGLIVKQNIPNEILHRRIVPVTLQNLIENAIKHNTADPESPLIIEMFQDENYLVVRNNLQKKKFVETSNQQGQQSMISLYNFLSPSPIEIEESKEYYSVKLPLL